MFFWPNAAKYLTFDLYNDITLCQANKARRYLLFKYCAHATLSTHNAGVGGSSPPLATTFRETRSYGNTEPSGANFTYPR